MTDQYSITTIDMLRHGECEGGDVYRGSHDVALHPAGFQQMHEATAKGRGWQKIISSPLQRCAIFAGKLAEQRGLPLHLNDAFRELHFGDWEGREIAEVWRENNIDAQLFFIDPRNAVPPNGETLDDFQKRVIKGWSQLLSSCRGEHVLLVTHGGTIRVLLAQVLDMPIERVATLNVPYACASRVRIFHKTEENHKDFSSLVFHNSVSFSKDSAI